MTRTGVAMSDSAQRAAVDLICDRVSPENMQRFGTPSRALIETVIAEACAADVSELVEALAELVSITDPDTGHIYDAAVAVLSKHGVSK